MPRKMSRTTETRPPGHLSWPVGFRVEPVHHKERKKKKKLTHRNSRVNPIFGRKLLILNLQ